MSNTLKDETSEADAFWYAFLTTGQSEFERRFRDFFGHLPTPPRCEA